MSDGFGTIDLGRGEYLFIFGVVLLLAVGFLPLITADVNIPVTEPTDVASSLDAYESDGTAGEILGIDRIDWLVVAGIGIVASVIVATEPWERIPLTVAGLSGVATVGLGILYVVDPIWLYSSAVQSQIEPVTRTGIGAYLAVVAGLVQFGGIYLGYSDSQSAASGKLGPDRSPAQPAAGGNRPSETEGMPAAERGQEAKTLQEQWDPRYQESSQQNQQPNAPQGGQRQGSPDRSQPQQPREDQPQQPQGGQPQQGHRQETPRRNQPQQPPDNRQYRSQQPPEHNQSQPPEEHPSERPPTGEPNQHEPPDQQPPGSEQTPPKPDQQPQPDHQQLDEQDSSRSASDETAKEQNSDTESNSTDSEKN